MSQSPIIDKIRKLLATAGDTAASDNEIQSAVNIAKKLMTAHHLGEDDRQSTGTRPRQNGRRDVNHSKIEIYRGKELLGHFVSHLDVDETVANIEADGMGAFADWSGEFTPIDESLWTRDEYDMDWLLDGEQFYDAADMVGDVTEVKE